MRVVIGLFRGRLEVEAAIRRLRSLGVSNENISVLTRAGESSDEYRQEIEDATAVYGSDVADGAVVGAGTGMIFGGLGGLLVGLGTIAIPGFGLVAAAGPLAGLLAGAGVGVAAGSVIGSLTSLGISDSDAKALAEGVHRGGTLIVAHVDESQVTTISRWLRFEAIS